MIPGYYRLARFIFMLITSLSLVIAIATTASILNWIPAHSIWAGMSFVPPLYTAGLGLTCALLLVVFKWRRSALVLCAIHTAFFLAFGDYNLSALWYRPATHSPWQLKVASLNVQYFTEGPINVASFLKSLAPDVMLLSEAEPDALKRSFFTKAIKPYEIHYAERGDTAIVSRHPILEIREINLPTHQPSLSGFNKIAEQKQRPYRTFMHAIVSIDHVPIHILSVRLIAGRGRSHSPIDQLEWGHYLMGEQDREVTTFIEYIKQLEGPVLFGGDLNATSSSVSIQRLNSIANDAYMQTHVWGRFTFKTKLLPIQREKNMPALRLDYLFVRNGLFPVIVDVVPGKVSDHFALLGTFAM